MECPTCHGTGCVEEYRIVHYLLPSGHHELILEQKNVVGNWSTLFVSSYGRHIASYCELHNIKLPIDKSDWISYPDNPERK